MLLFFFCLIYLILNHLKSFHIYFILANSQNATKNNKCSIADKACESITNNKEKLSQKISFSEYLEKPNKINNFNINNIYKICEFFSFQKDKPLWYIYQPLTKSSKGPLSSLNLEDMLKENIINLDSEIRLLDIYASENNNFTFLKLGELNDFGNNQNNIFNLLSNFNISNLIQNFLKGNKFYKIKFHFNKENVFDSLEMVKNFDKDEKIECPIDLENTHNIKSLFNKTSTSVNKQFGEHANNTLINHTNNLFNKSNKIEKGVNYIRNINSNFPNSSSTPIKKEAKLFPIEIEKPNKVQNSLNQETMLKVDQAKLALNNKSK